MFQSRQSLLRRGRHHALNVPLDKGIKVFPKDENTIRFLRSWYRNLPITYTGTRKGSPLNKGKTWICRAPQGLSEDALEVRFGALWGKLMEEEAAWVKGVGFRWTKFPRRCISRETSFESYVRPVELC